MSLRRFRQSGQPRWEQLEDLLEDLEGRSGRVRSSRSGLSELPELFRRLCADLALARHRSYPVTLVDRLNNLALRCQRQMYRARTSPIARAAHFLAIEFPRRVRAEAWSVFWCFMLLFGVGFATGFAVTMKPELVYSILDPAAVAEMESMHPTGESPDRDGRMPGDDVAMFGLYIFNNVGIGFSCYAGGFLAGIGTILALTFNGLVLGAVFGHLGNVGAGPAIWSFACGHGSFEMIGIAIAGVAGLKLASGIVRPGRRSLAESIAHAGRESMPLIAGAGAMIALAAFIEAFWSAREVDLQVKYTVGVAMLVFVLGWLAVGGRSFRGRSTRR